MTLLPLWALAAAAMAANQTQTRAPGMAPVVVPAVSAPLAPAALPGLGFSAKTLSLPGVLEQVALPVPAAAASPAASAQGASARTAVAAAAALKGPAGAAAASAKTQRPGTAAPLPERMAATEAGLTQAAAAGGYALTAKLDTIFLRPAASAGLPVAAAAAQDGGPGKAPLGKPGKSRLRKLMDTVPSLSAVNDLPPGERKLVWLAFLWSFLTISAYTIIGAVKAGMLLMKFGEAAIPWTYMASALATGLAVWAFNSYAKKASRKALVGGALAALALSLAGWAAIVAVAPAAGWVAFAFSLWADVFGIMSVTLFWSYADDLFSTDTAKKVFGLLGAAGPLGAILGSTLAMLGAVQIGLSPLLWVAAALFAGTLLVHRVMEKLPHPVKETAAAAAETKKEEGSVLKTIWASPFLIFLAVVVVLERLVPDFSNYLFGAMVRAHITGAEQIASFQGMYGLIQGVVSLLASLFLTRWILKKLGVGAALTTAPLANLAGFLVFPFHPTLGWTAGYNGAEGLLRYTWFKAAKEATYTAESRTVIYRVKAFIEMFLYRFARGIAGFILLMLTGQGFLAFGPAAVAWVGVPLAALWAWSAWRMGRAFNARAGEAPRP
jgi:AAA family ATP:ADP antiporter